MSSLIMSLIYGHQPENRTNCFEEFLTAISRNPAFDGVYWCLPLLCSIRHLQNMVPVEIGGQLSDVLCRKPAHHFLAAHYPDDASFLHRGWRTNLDKAEKVLCAVARGDWHIECHLPIWRNRRIRFVAVSRRYANRIYRRRSSYDVQLLLRHLVDGAARRLRNR